MKTSKKIKVANNRRCIVTKEIKNKSELIRIVRTKEGNYFVNSDKNGRGVYISKVLNNPQAILKKRYLNRAFKTTVPVEVYEELIKIIEKGEHNEKTQ